jgi:gliding motility-associated protein GldM
MAAKLDTRQKMINMMYLVFIAMLALNIGKEVLATLGNLSSDLESSTTQVEAASEEIYSKITANASTSLNYKIPSIMVVQLKNEADAFYDFIQVIKDSLIVGEDGVKNKYIKQITDVDEESETFGEEFPMVSYQEMDKSAILDDMFFVGDALAPTGEEYVAKFKNFPNSIKTIVDELVFREEEFKVAKTQLDGSKESESVVVTYDFNSVKSGVKDRFNYTEKVLKENGTLQDYLYYNFYNFPVIASIAKLTKIQSDIRFVENSVLNEINRALGGGSLSSFQTLLVSEKPSFYTSEVVNASIVMGKKDAAYEPDRVELFINGTQLNKGEYSIEKGAVVLNKRIRSAGTYDLTGFIFKKNVDTQIEEKIPVNLKLEITREPNSAVVSADNMKVFYRGLRNPTSVSIPGVASNTIIPSSSNAKFIKVGNGWGAVPTSDFSIQSMTVSVSGVLNGKRKQFDGGEFRILEPPPGEGSVKVNDNYYKPTENVPKKYLANGMITGNKPADFLYDFIIEVTSFDIKVGSSPSKKVKGNTPRSNKQAVADVNSAGRGTIVRISNIKANAKDGDFVNPNYIVKDFILILE